VRRPESLVHDDDLRVLAAVLEPDGDPGVLRGVVDGFVRPRVRDAAGAIYHLEDAGDVAAVRYLLTEAGLRKARPEPIDVGALARYDRPVPGMADYDTLLVSTPCAGNA
jgi:hypothetical protein